MLDQMLDQVQPWITNNGYLHPGSIPASVIVSTLALKFTKDALRDDSKGKIVNLKPGQAIIVRGDLIHDGVGYKDINYRLHCYLAVQGDDEWVPDDV